MNEQDDRRPDEARRSPGTRGPRVLGDFVLEREIGRGGMGVVWLATQRSMGRKVALKLLPTFASLDDAAVARFRREAEATGRVAHPGIVPVYAVGQTEGVQYFAMELIEGPPLAELLNLLSMRQAGKLRASLVEEAQVQDRWPALREPPGGGTGNAYVRSCARLCADVANALAAAHRERVIHRDLKPSNILIHPAGRPVLVDFGLARDEQAAGLTRSGDQIGTPAYMAPEQARGVRQIDARVDVYGLGAVLYELLTLRPPFEGTTAAETTRRILEEEPVPVRRRNPTVPVDLAAIVHRCLQKDRDARYPAIEGLELDLRAFLQGRAVHAELPGHAARLQSALQRHRRSLWLTATTVAVTAVVAAAAGVIGDSGDRADGRVALAEAGRSLIERCDVAKARDLYERAAALTKDPAGVRAQRLADFRAAFARHYGDGAAERAALRQFAAVFDAGERGAVHTELDRLDGRGAIRFASRAGELRTAGLALRRATADGIEPEWQPVQAGDPLPVGEYLVRATAQDGAVAVQWTVVKQDGEALLEPRYLPAGALPKVFAPIVDPRNDEVAGVALCEVTCGEWQDWLRGIADPGLRAELQPLGQEGDAADPDRPVRGLSFHQARAFAQAHGAHLPTLREHWLAGSAGLQSLQQPWGGAADPERVAADPFRLDGPEAVRSRAAGVSPLGVFHVLGNVAEIGAAWPDGTLVMGGGSYLDDPASLRLSGEDGVVPSAPLATAAVQHPGAGLRLYRFVPAADDARAAAAADERREELRTTDGGAELQDWRLCDDGTIECRVESTGRYDGGDRSRSIVLDTAGFLQRRDELALLDGHGNVLAADVRIDAGGERSVLTAELPATLRAGQGCRLFATARLQPASGLLGAGDAFVLRLPLRRGGRAARDCRLLLPRGCRVDDVSPPPARWTQDGCTVLAWERTGEGRAEVAVVRFRRDGAFGELPCRAAAVQRTESFLAAWNERGDALATWLAPDFVRAPDGLGRERVLAGTAVDRLQLVEVRDVTRVGRVETVELTGDWTMAGPDGEPLRLESWPLVLQLRHDADGAGGVQAVRLSPRTVADRGRYENGGYVHPGLRVRLRPLAATVVARTFDACCDLQVELSHDAATARLLGHMAAPAETAAAIRFRLSGGAALRGGRCLRVEPGPVRTEEWLFERDGVASRERWRFLQHGRRHLLLRLAATGPTVDAAERAFASEATSRWFDDVAAALVVE